MIGRGMGGGQGEGGGSSLELANEGVRAQVTSVPTQSSGYSRSGVVLLDRARPVASNTVVREKVV